MGRWPQRTGGFGRQQVTVGLWHPWCLGAGFKVLSGYASPASSAWPAANRAILVPFRVPVPVTVYQMVMGSGATAAGNFDIGIYDRLGNRLVSSGATAKSASVEQVLNITDTALLPGVYYMALAANGTNNYNGWTISGVTPYMKAMGVRQASSAYTLPSTVTFETAASAYFPNISVWLRSQ
jgi:hypothetical protein